MSELTTLKGVGKGRAEALAGASVETLADMAALDGTRVDEVAGALGVSREQVESWQTDARLAVALAGLNETLAKAELEESLAEAALNEPDDSEPEKNGQADRDPREIVLVRVLCERGLLNGRAVWRGEAHRTSYRQYLEAVRMNPEGYELVGA